MEGFIKEIEELPFGGPGRREADRGQFLIELSLNTYHLEASAGPGRIGDLGLRVKRVRLKIQHCSMCACSLQNKQ